MQAKNKGKARLYYALELKQSCMESAVGSKKTLFQNCIADRSDRHRQKGESKVSGTPWDQRGAQRVQRASI